eukprot:7009990-Prymnesium_polylepis.1
MLNARGINIGAGQLADFATAASHRQVLCRVLANVANACAQADDEAGAALWQTEGRELQRLCAQADQAKRATDLEED